MIAPSSLPVRATTKARFALSARCVVAILGVITALLASACGSGPSQPPAAPVESLPSAAPVSSALTPPVVHHTVAELDPSLATAKAPDVFQARFTTSNGAFVIEVHRDWAPNGADRFYNLVKMGFFDDSRFFRAISGFMVQFGIPGDPQVAAKWRDSNIQDDPAKQSNLRGTISFAQAGSPNSRTTQVFISYRDNSQLDASNFAPFGKVIDGMDTVSTLYKGYGEGAPGGTGPSQDRIQGEGNAYLDAEFPKLDRIVSAQIVAP
jgi:peptidyl-prolyl cis-trans isomerase A (cyclophilin A)